MKGGASAEEEGCPVLCCPCATSFHSGTSSVVGRKSGGSRSRERAVGEATEAEERTQAGDGEEERERRRGRRKGAELTLGEVGEAEGDEGDSEVEDVVEDVRVERHALGSHKRGVRSEAQRYGAQAQRYGAQGACGDDVSQLSEKGLCGAAGAGVFCLLAVQQPVGKRRRYPLASAASTTVGIATVAATTDELQNILRTQHLQIASELRCASAGMNCVLVNTWQLARALTLADLWRLPY
eukprot:665207-Rhodomonas_salina.1